jgi:glycosyltransferase involved in cell wall biosynthesis
MKITLVTDTWDNINGVVTTLRATVSELREEGHEVQVIEPSSFRSIPAPSYPEVRLCWNLWRVGPMIESFDPDAIHIATEGPLGLAARWYCKVDKRSIPHNTSYHTKFPEYLHTYWKLPLSVGYWAMRCFHKFSTKVLVTTPSMRDELNQKGFNNLELWNRGVDHQLFNHKRRRKHNGQGYILCVSRVSKEKGLEDFCRLKDYKRVLVGNGPYLEELKTKYPDVEYVGYKKGKELADYYANADVFVFPSKSDTFGVVMLEAISCGTPIAAYPVTGPIDIVEDGINGCLAEDLIIAVEFCKRLDRKKVHRSSKKYTWSSCTKTFLDNLTLIR